MMSREIRLTDHARKTMAARHVEFSEVRDTVLNYHTRRESSMHRGVPTPETYLYSKGNLTVVVAEKPEYLVVKTVLLATTDQWSDEDARRRARRPSSSGARDQE